MTTTHADIRVIADAEPKTKRADERSTAENVAARLQALEQMDHAALRVEWRRLYRAHPPKRVTRDLLMLGVAWKIQEQAYGGLGAATKRRVAELAKTLERGRPQDGLAEIERALHIVENNCACFQLPEILRLKGELLKLLPNYDVDAVITCFRDAMATARMQGTPLLELRAATSLARFLFHRRNRTEARRLLSELCRRSDGMPESIELDEARLLLAQ
jgi:Protein of unknown function (DUF2924)